MPMSKIVILLFTLIAGGSSLTVQSQQKTDTTQTYTQEGVSVNFTVKGEPVAGRETTVSFKIVDTNSGKALSSLRPAAWIDRHIAGQPTDARVCRDASESIRTNTSPRCGFGRSSSTSLRCSNRQALSIGRVSLLPILSDRRRQYVVPPRSPLSNKSPVQSDAIQDAR